MNTNDQDDRELLTKPGQPEQVNATAHNESSATLNNDLSSYKKKKYIIIGIIAAIIIILAIVLPIVLTKSNGGDTPTPGPTPHPIIPPGNNPYSGNSSEIVITGESVSG